MPTPSTTQVKSDSEMTVTRPLLAVLLVVFLVLGFTIGILIGVFAIEKAGPAEDKTVHGTAASHGSGEDCEEEELLDHLTEDSFTKESNYTRQLIEEIDGEKIMEALTYIGSISHVAGTKGNAKVREYIYNAFKDLEMDSVEKYTYEVLLSYPNDDIKKKNKVEIFHPSTGHISLFSKEREMKGTRTDDQFPVAYNAYSKAKLVMGKLVYANFATDDDFEILKQNDIDVNGTIIIARNGKIFRGNKVLNAQRNGALGIILYSDPEEDEHKDSSDETEELGLSQSLPPEGLQRGTIYEKIGDPLTPGYPAVDEAPRLDIDEAPLPEIPSQPVDYKFASDILKHMAGRELADEKLNWKGQLRDVRYRLGPGFEGLYEGYLVRMDINNELEMKNITNVIARIEGEVEPDRYVIIGNPYDAWGYGAVNPSSSTAQLLEIARAFSELRKDGWRPRRTIIFAAWDAGKFGQIGSTEWVEEHLDLLMARTVAYINSESCIETDDIEVSSSPVLDDAILATAKLIADEDKVGSTLFDDWNDKLNRTNWISSLGAESDHAAFALYAGIPSVDIHAQHESTDAQSYPRQNTRYDNLDLIRLIDPNMDRSESCAQFTAVLARYLADSAILPFNVENMAEELLKTFQKYNATVIPKVFVEKDITTFDNLGRAILDFEAAAEKFNENLDEVDMKNPMDVRMVNDQLMLVERAFIRPTGDDDDWFHRHLLYGPTDLDKNADGMLYVFEELLELLDDVKREEEEEAREELQGFEEPDPKDDIKVDAFWDENEQYIIDVIVALKEAVKILSSLPNVYEEDDDSGSDEQ